jgi:transposase
MVGVHALVALAFIGPRPNGQVVRHLDGDKKNNRPDNLAYGEKWVNAADARRHGTLAVGSRVHTAKLTEATVTELIHRAATENYETLAKEFGISYASVSNAVNGRTWQHLGLAQTRTVRHHNTKEKLTEDQARAIVSRYQLDGPTKLAAEFGVAYSTVVRIGNGVLWRHLQADK